MKNATDVLIEMVNTKGLPETVITWGRISESLSFSIQGYSKPVVSSEESLVGELIVGNHEDTDLAYTGLESLQAVIQAMINNQFRGEDLSVVATGGSERLVSVLVGDEPKTTSHDFELLVPEQEFIASLSQIGVKIETEDLEAELSELCSNFCEESSGEKSFMSEAGVAVVKFSDGSELKFGELGGQIVVLI